MHSNGRLWATAVVALLLGVIAGSAAMTMAETSRQDKLEQTLSSVMQRLQSSEDKVADLSDQLADAQIAPSASPSSTPSAPAPSQPATTERQFAFVKELNPGSNSIVVDYATFLTGDDAAKAATKAGEESPPPNDYFIVNDSAKLRTLRLGDTVVVRLTTKPGEGAVVGGFETDVATLAAYLENESEETASLRVGGYWLTIDDDVVTGIEEQYTP